MESFKNNRHWDVVFNNVNGVRSGALIRHSHPLRLTNLLAREQRWRVIKGVRDLSVKISVIISGNINKLFITLNYP
jgi:hypothetical protein